MFRSKSSQTRTNTILYVHQLHVSSIKQINPNDSRWVEDIERKSHGLLAGQFAGMAASLYSMSQHACSVLETREVVKESPFFSN